MALLGPLQVVADGGPVKVKRPKERALLGLLALHAGRIASSTSLIDALWEDDPPRSARKTLQTYVSNLRKRLGNDAIVTEAPGYALAVDPDQVDAHRFERLVADGRAALGRGDPEWASELLESALALWRGEPLADLAASSGARAEAVRLGELRLGAIEDHAEARLDLGRHAELVPDLEALLVEHPYRERLWRHLAVALYRCDRQQDALGAYQRARRRLVDELGVEPGPALQAVERAVLDQDSSLDFSPPRPPTTATRGRGHLPLEVSDLVGREQDLDELTQILLGDRAVTLVGPGGVGKTRLAVRAARACQGRFADGARMCDLAQESESSAAYALAEVIGARAEPGDSVEDRVARALEARELLLLVDNAEHVADRLRDLLTVVLRQCSGVTVLATSRRPIAVESERLVDVHPLPVDAAMELFARRTRAADPTFEVDPVCEPVLAEICERLDGLPLAIELAAARVRPLGLRGVVDVLDRQFDVLDEDHALGNRPRSLRATVDWSYGLLTERDRSLFCRLGVFPGSFTLDAARQVADHTGSDPAEIERGIAGLVDHSLLERRADPAGDRCYRMLETVRAHAHDLLSESADLADVEASHARWATALAEALAEERVDGDTATAVTDLDRELPNLRAAHEWARHADAPDVALRLAYAMFWFAYPGIRSELFDWATSAADAFADVDHPLLGEVFGVAAMGALQRGDLVEAGELAQRGRERVSDPSAGAPVLADWVLAQCALRSGDFEAADDLFVGLERRETPGFGPDHWRQWRLTLSSWTAPDERLVSESSVELERIRAEGNDLRLSFALYAHAEVLSAFHPDDAVASLRESIELSRDIDNRLMELAASVSLASIAGRHGNSLTALASFSDIIERWQVRGAWAHQWTTLRNLVELLARVGRFGDAVTLHRAGLASAIAPPVSGEQGTRLVEALARAEPELDADTLRDARRRGDQMSDEDAVEFALAVVDDLLAHAEPY